MLTSNIIDLNKIAITPATPQLAIYQHIVVTSGGTTYHGFVSKAMAWFGQSRCRYVVDYEVQNSEGGFNLTIDYEHGLFSISDTKLEN